MKAIAIVDIDNKLLEEYEDFAIECNLIATSKEDTSWRDSVKWVGEVKLKPMPDRRYAIQGMIGYEGTKRECKGYNRCIDEILEEESEQHEQRKENSRS